MNLPIHHGGNPWAARRQYKLGDAPLLDFSASLNPLGPPPAGPGCGTSGSRPGRCLSRAGLPPVDRADCRASWSPGRSGDRGGRVDRASGVDRAVAPGSPRIPTPRRSATRPGRWPILTDPTYAEYRRISKHNELRAKVWGEHILGWEQDVLPREAHGIFWTGHPNNPTGRPGALDPGNLRRRNPGSSDNRR